MEQDDIKKKCKEFLDDLGVPGFIVFGWQQTNKEYGVVYVNRKTPPPVTLKGLLWAAHDFAKKKL